MIVLVVNSILLYWIPLSVDVQRPRCRVSTRAFPLLPPVPHHIWYLRILPAGPRESEATEREATLPSLAQPISTKTTYQKRKTHNNIASRYGTLTTDGQRKISKHVDCDKQKTYSDRTGDHPSTKQPATLPVPITSRTLSVFTAWGCTQGAAPVGQA